jgi:hypothetical protein
MALTLLRDLQGSIKIEVNFKPLKEMRYPSLDDYYYKEDGTLVYDIADMGSVIYNKLNLIHAIQEEMLTNRKGTTEPEIAAFDVAFEEKIKSGARSEDAEPGEEIGAPYRDEHLVAEGIGQMLMGYMGISVKVFMNDIREFFKSASKL